MAGPKPIIDRMFLDESFLINCPKCNHTHPFKINKVVSRKCARCEEVKAIINFKYESERTYRVICNSCKEDKRGTRNVKSKFSYTMMPCGTCLQEGKSEGEATVIVNSKGVFDELGENPVYHIHQKGIYSKKDEDSFKNH